MLDQAKDDVVSVRLPDVAEILLVGSPSGPRGRSGRDGDADTCKLIIAIHSPRRFRLPFAATRVMNRVVQSPQSERKTDTMTARRTTTSTTAAPGAPQGAQDAPKAKASVKPDHPCDESAQNGQGRERGLPQCAANRTPSGPGQAVRLPVPRA